MRWIPRVSLPLTSALLVSGALLPPAQAGAQVFWTDWTSTTAGGATGTLAIPGQPPIGVTYAGVYLGIQTAPGSPDYWVPRPPTAACVPPQTTLCDPWAVPTSGITNPSSTDIIRIVGGPTTGTQTVTFSQAIANPIFAILSLGQPGVQVTYDFNRPFEILNYGPGAVFGGPGTLTAISNPATNSFRLTGVEGNGIIRFLGNFDSISWTVPVAESWHGFTIGVQGLATPDTTVPEPATFALAATGLLMLGGIARARARRG